MFNSIIHQLENAGILEEQFSKAQILCLPENVLRTKDYHDLMETTDMDRLAKLLRRSGLEVFTFMDAGVDLAAIDRRSGDRWLGTIWIRDNAAFPLLISVVAGIIVLGIDRKTDGSYSTPHVEPSPQVHVELIIDKKSGDYDSLKYNGDGETLIKILNALKDGEQSKN